MSTLVAAQQTPMVRQYMGIKQDYQDALLFFRLGDFYELFFDDAHVASKELGLTLTGRGKDDSRIAMCGVPHHASESYIHKLVQKGYKVALCDQVEAADESKGLTKRDVVKVFTPGTVIGSDLMAADENHFLLGISGTGSGQYAASFIDCSTGEFRCCLLENMSELTQFIDRINPKECLIEDGLELSVDCPHSSFTSLPLSSAKQQFLGFFNLAQLSGFGLQDMESVLPAAWAVLEYVSHTHKQALEHITRCIPYQLDASMILDAVTVRNLELFSPLHSSEKTGTLFWVLNKTKTSMGARLLRHWLGHPLTDMIQLNQRLDCVEALKNDILSREEIRDCLTRVYDLQRLLSRIASQVNNPRDCVALKDSLVACLELPDILVHFPDSGPFQEILSFFRSQDTFHGLIKLIEAALPETPPTTITQGHVFNAGYNQELDDLLTSFKEIRQWIGTLESVEQEQTGIKTLRVGFNKVFGYYFQVSKGQTDHVPEHYIRKQTLTNAERYITPELKEKETILLQGEDKQIQLEQQLYADFIAQIKTAIPAIQEAAAHICTLDCFQSLAMVSQQNNYVRPEFTEDAHSLVLEESRHPVLEKQSSQPVISNSMTFSDQSFMFLITGPNMAGKSTLMKQVAITVIMAQMGCFVPASAARIGIVDRCFTRIGAADNLSEGQSTFMVEMTETATILHNATEKSLVLLDEIGRGTSTYDGMSIAGSVMTYLHNQIGARTLFATHYHELSELELTCAHVTNVSLAIDEENGVLAFRYQLVNGPADKSYGVHVAQMAGLPEAVISKARSLLAHYEAQGHSPGAEQLALF